MKRRLAWMVLFGYAWLACSPGAEPPLDNLVELVDDRTAARFVEGRLSAGFAHRPYAADLPSSSWREGLDRATRGALLTVAHDIERRAASVPEPRSLTALAVVSLLYGEPGRAVAELEAAVHREAATVGAGQAAILADLAAAYLARADAEDRPFDFVLALDATRRAVAADPAWPAAHFNRGLVSSRLGLVRLARRSFARYLELEPAGGEYDGWRREARERLATLEAPDLEARWTAARRDLGLLFAPPEPERITLLVEAFPFHARRLGEEELLALWAELDGTDPARAQNVLATARALGDALAAQRGTWMLRDAVAAIEAAGGPLSPRREALREGHLAFEEALDAYQVQDMARASEAFERARQRLDGGGSPLARWAEFYLGITEYYSDVAAAEARWRDLRQRLDPATRPALVGRVEWMLGTAAVVRGLPAVSLEHYAVARERLESSSGATGAAFVHVLAAEAYARLGEVDQGWRHRLAAYEGLARAGNPRRFHSMINESAQALLRQGRFAAALDFLDELVASARQWGNPTAVTEAFLQRGRTWIESGQQQRGLEDLEKARLSLAELEPGDLRRHLALSLDLATGRALAEVDPAHGIATLGQAMDAQREIGYDFDRVPALIARAGAWQTLGDDEAAAADLLSAIEAYEDLRSNVGDERLRRSAFSQARPAFDAMTRLLSRRGGDFADPDAAFDMAERGRGRFLLDLHGGGPLAAGPGPVTASGLVERLPRGWHLVQYAALEEELLIWQARRGEITLERMPVGAERLASLAAALRWEIERRAPPTEIRAASAALHEVLVEPVLARMEPVDGAAPPRVVFVPDRFLQRVPFAALFDAARGQYLVERFPLAVAPSATLFLAALEPRGAAPDARGEALLVGEPDLAHSPAGRMPDLPEAALEIAELGRLYPGAVRLAGAAATEERMLAELERAPVIHFAGHARTNPDALQRSHLLLAPGAESDGILYAHELYGRRLAADLVVLSACRTMDSGGDDREGLMGLAGIFLASGASAVVASLWQADDAASRLLMTSLHRRVVAGADPLAALRSAQLELLRHEEPVYRSPAFWAAFEVVGGARR